MRFLRSPLIHLALIVSLGILAYSSVLDTPFIFDDYPNIILNYSIMKLTHIPTMFTGSAGIVASRPLMNATFALNYYFGGFDPAGYHAFNIALHLINGILLYFLVLMTGSLLKYDKGSSRPVALLASLIFVVHPLQTEAVTYAVSRSVLLAAMFYFSGIMLFAKAATTERRRGLYIAALFIVSLLGAASREDFITFPVMLLLYDLFFIAGFRAREIYRRWGLYVAVLPACAYIIYLALNNTYDTRTEFAELAIPPLQYALTQLNVQWTYLRLLLLPINQNLDYGYPIAKTLFELPTLFSFLGYLGLWAGAVLFARRTRPAAFAVLWYLVALLPISFLLVIAGEALDLKLGDVILEHRLYLPSAGLFAGFAAVAVYLASRLRLAWAKKAFALCLVLTVAVFSVAAYKRNGVWQSPISIWSDVAEKSPGNARGLINLANAYVEEGLFDSAIHFYYVALSNFSSDLSPRYYAVVYLNLGHTYLQTGLTDMAIQAFETGIALDPTQPSAYSGLGDSYLRKGILDRAIASYQMSVRSDAHFTQGYNSLGNVYLKLGLVDKAIENYEIAVGVDPRYATGYNNLGVAYVQKGLSDRAIGYFEQAIEIDPQYARAYVGLGNAYILKGLTDRAIEYYQYSVRLNPKDPYAHWNLGAAYNKKGMKEEAQVHFNIADSLVRESGGPGAEFRDAAEPPGLK